MEENSEIIHRRRKPKKWKKNYFYHFFHSIVPFCLIATSHWFWYKFVSLDWPCICLCGHNKKILVHIHVLYCNSLLACLYFTMAGLPSSSNFIAKSFQMHISNWQLLFATLVRCYHRWTYQKLLTQNGILRQEPAQTLCCGCDFWHS